MGFLAERLRKGQLTLRYAFQRHQKLNGVAVLIIAVRKAVLTAAGRTLYQRGKRLASAGSGTRDLREIGLNIEQRRAVSTKATSIRAVRMGLRFVWYPVENIIEELQSGQLTPLPWRNGSDRYGGLIPGVRRSGFGAAAHKTLGDYHW